MAVLDVSATESFITMINQGADEAQSAFARTFGKNITLSVLDARSLDTDTLAAEYSRKGLALVLVSSGQGIVILIPNNHGLIPDWCDNPDATGKSKLSTFAQEWGMILVPDDFFPEDFLAAVQDDLAESVKTGKIGDNPAIVELEIKTESGQSKVAIVWPILSPNDVLIPLSQLATPTSSETGAATATVSPSSASLSPSSPSFPSSVSSPAGGIPSFGSPFEFGGPSTDAAFSPFVGTSFDEELDEKRLTTDDLPGFARSLLKVRVPIAAILARSRKPIKTVLEFGIGSVVQFDKSCDELIELEVGNTVIATGEAVKVGEKFGLRINTMLLPKERFHRVEVRRDGEFRKTRHLPQLIGKAPIKSLEPLPNHVGRS